MQNDIFGTSRHYEIQVICNFWGKNQNFSFETQGVKCKIYLTNGCYESKIKLHSYICFHVDQILLCFANTEKCILNRQKCKECLNKVNSELLHWEVSKLFSISMYLPSIYTSFEPLSIVQSLSVASRNPLSISLSHSSPQSPSCSISVLFSFPSLAPSVAGRQECLSWASRRNWRLIQTCQCKRFHLLYIYKSPSFSSI